MERTSQQSSLTLNCGRTDVSLEEGGGGMSIIKCLTFNGILLLNYGQFVFAFYEGCSVCNVPWVTKIKWQVIRLLNIAHLFQ